MFSLDVTEPAKVVELARATQVSTEHATADVATLEVHDIFVRGERTRVRVEVPERAKVIVVLFADGIGVTRITESGKLQSGTENFLIRTRTYFLRRGFTTVVFDGLTNHPGDLCFGFRRTAAHEMDIGAVIAHLRGRFGLLVWLVGTSRATTSVVSGASQLDVHRPDGIVLTSFMLAPVTNGNHVFDFSLEKISIPALITHHREDSCVATLARDVPRLARELSSAAPKGVKFYEGGTLGDNECGARSHHGYQGIEEQVIDDIAAWIPRHYEASISSRQSRQLVQPPLCSSRISSLSLTDVGPDARCIKIERRVASPKAAKMASSFWSCWVVSNNRMRLRRRWKFRSLYCAGIEAHWEYRHVRSFGAPLLDLVEWVADEPRPYEDVMDAWRTSCPRLPVWEDAADRGYLIRDKARCDGRLTTIVSATPAGRAYLNQNGRCT